jgi:poly-gamma-glutamate synthesis protein (capsule biosynthesis protein)
VDVVHGHSSHHIKGIEVYRERPIIYGCGDFLNDYEGIGGHEEYRPDLSLMYFPMLDACTGRLLQFAVTPTQIRCFRVNRAPAEGVRWLFETLNHEGAGLGTRVERQADDTFLLRWS